MTAARVASLVLVSALLIALSSIAPPLRPARASSNLRQPPDALLRTVYEPSAMELLWRRNIVEWKAAPCDVLRDKFMGETQALLATFGAQGREPVEDATNRVAFLEEFAVADGRGLLSHMTYVFQSGRTSRVALEPLFGILRDPRTSCPYSLAKQSPWHPILEKPAYMLIQDKFVVLHDPAIAALAALELPVINSPAHNGRRQRRAFLFDLGGTHWTRDPAPGSRWIFRQARRLGIDFDHVFVWEYVPTSSEKYYNKTPVEELSHVHFFNWGVNAVVGDAKNPLTMLLRVAGPDDFVAFKLDIDAQLIETEIVRQILADPEVSSRIDEFYWEHHVDMPDMAEFWGKGVFSGSLADSYDLFTRLREVGVRAHSWP